MLLLITRLEKHFLYDNYLKVKFDFKSQQGMLTTVKYTVFWESASGSVTGKPYMIDSSSSISANIVLQCINPVTGEPNTDSYNGFTPAPLFINIPASKMNPQDLTDPVVATGTYTLLRETSTNMATLRAGMTFTSGAIYLGGTGNWKWHSSYSVPDWLEETATEFSIPTDTDSGSTVAILGISDFTDEDGPTITYAYDRARNVDSAELSIWFTDEYSTFTSAARTVPISADPYKFEFTEEDQELLYRHLLNFGPSYQTTDTLKFVLKVTEVAGEEVLVTTDHFTKTFNFVNYAPTFNNPQFWDTNPITIAATNDPNCLVKYMSNVDYDMRVELHKGALEVLGCYVSNGGRIVEGFTEGNYGTITSNSFYLSATDNRFFTGTTSKSFSTFYGEFIEYIKLTNNIKCSPISGEGVLNVTLSGKYFNKKFGPAGKDNAMTVKYRAYPKGSQIPEWSTLQVGTPTMTNNADYTYTFPVNNLDYTKQHVVEVIVSDLLMEVTGTTNALAKPVFYWNNDEFNFNVPVKVNGIPVITEYDDGDKTLQGHVTMADGATINDGVTINGGATINGPTAIDGALTVQGTTLDTSFFNGFEKAVEEGSVAGFYVTNNGSSFQSGNYTWYYRKWANGTFESWCTLPLSTWVTTAWGNMYVAYHPEKTDLAYPIQPVDTPFILVSLGAGATKGILMTDSSYAADNISTGRYNIVSPVSVGSATYRLNYYVRGRWK